MTDREKAIIMAYTGTIMLTGEKFSIFHKYIEDILGRSVWTHELACDSVSEEIKEKSKSDFFELCENEGRPQGEWISVSERLPEEKTDPHTNDFEIVLCTTIWEDVRPYKFGKSIGHEKSHFWHGGEIMDGYVIAWQPLPEPYEEGGEEE